MILLHLATIVSRTHLVFGRNSFLQVNKVHIFWSLHAARYSWSNMVGDWLAVHLHSVFVPNSHHIRRRCVKWQSTVQQPGGEGVPKRLSSSGRHTVSAKRYK